MTSPYTEAVMDFRRRKDEHFAAGQGPVDAAAFHGLRYYPPDPAWAFSAPLTPTEEQAEFTLDTNTGQPRTMTLYGTVTLPLPGGQHILSVFAPLGDEQPQRVFIPFRDATSGQETYGAGRYLDAPLARTETVQTGDGEALVSVDFNLAYHPYCAYGDGWTCPLPPRENVLPVAIQAGERLPES